MAGSNGSAREEAERLVATVLAMAAQSGLGGAAHGRDDKDDSLFRTGARVAEGIGALGDTVAGLVGQLTGASGGHRAGTGSASATSGSTTGHAARDSHPAGATKGWATGSAECCVCPVCKAIAGLRDPSPHTAARLATGAGEVATGVASMLRGFSTITGTRPRRPAQSRAPRPAPAPPAPDHAWSDTSSGTGRHKAGGAATDAWAAATASSAADVEAERRAAAAAAAAAKGRGIGPDLSASAGGPRTKDGVQGDRRSGNAAGGDVWAAATADHGVRGMAQSPGVDHDDPGPAARAGRVDTGPAPAAEAAEDPATGPGDDARGGARGETI